MRHNLSKIEKEKIGLECCNCHSMENLEYHHIVPVALGGSDEIMNMVCLCSNCHHLIHYGQKENNLSISKLIKEGMKKTNKHIGRPKTSLENSKVANIIEQMKKYSKDFNGNLDVVNTCKKIGISRTTYYKYKKLFLE